VFWKISESQEAGKADRAEVRKRERQEVL